MHISEAEERRKENIIRRDGEDLPSLGFDKWTKKRRVVFSSSSTTARRVFKWATHLDENGLTHRDYHAQSLIQASCEDLTVEGIENASKIVLMIR